MISSTNIVLLVLNFKFFNRFISKFNVRFNQSFVRQAELARMRQEVEHMRQRCGELEAENGKQHKIIMSADAERLRQKKELDQVINERDILGTQLIRRNDELALLYEKIKIQQSTLNKGEIQYRQRLEDIRLLKLEVKKLRREKNILLKSVANVDELR